MTLEMYGVLHGDGSIEEVPFSASVCIEDNYVVCRDAEEREVARFASSDIVFGKVDALRRIAYRLRSADWRRVESLYRK